MTNLEKYPNTADAVKAWNEYKDYGNPNISFENWLGLDYIEPLTLLEAAKRLVHECKAYTNFNYGDGKLIYSALERAIAAEEARPRRNFERFATAEEAFAVFSNECKGHWCEACRLERKDKVSVGSDALCVAHWLYSFDPNLDRAEEKSEEAGKLEDRK